MTRRKLDRELAMWTPESKEATPWISIMREEFIHFRSFLDKFLSRGAPRCCSLCQAFMRAFRPDRRLTKEIGIRCSRCTTECRVRLV